MKGDQRPSLSPEQFCKAMVAGVRSMVVGSTPTLLGQDSKPVLTKAEPCTAEQAGLHQPFPSIPLLPALIQIANLDLRNVS